MCGRYALNRSPAELKEHFDLANQLELTPRYNIAPSQTAPVVRLDEAGNRVFTLARWGLIPSWVKDPKEVQHPINAKAETAAIKPMFRHAYRKSRVLVPADAFYEWVTKDGKQPYLIRLRDGAPMGMGGLLEHWNGPEGDVSTFTILTTNANSLMAKIHDRMPVIINPEDYTTWLDTNFDDVIKLQAMSLPYPDRFMEAYPVSRKVNSPKNDSPDLIDEVQV
jgi:putative SOS response-associated peptidase YedK